jgi:uncharacterized protein (TIGR00369 family)
MSDALPEPAEPADSLAEPEEGTPIVVDRAAVGRCFGCGQENHQGLRLRFRRLADGSVETSVRLAEHFCGVDGVVHGGIQATILDEVCGVAAQLALPDDASANPCVTAELSMRFRRAVPMAEVVVARARVVEVAGRSFHVEGAIVGSDGAELTTATSRWVQLAG